VVQVNLVVRGGLAYDPEAEATDGALFLRRSDLGRFASEQFAAHRRSNPSGSNIRHLQDTASDIAKQGDRFHIALQSGENLIADMVVVATSNERPAIPGPFDSMVGHPVFFPDPWDLEAVHAIPNDARLLFIGTALTAADLIVTLLRLGHRGPMTAMSRRGLRSTGRPLSGGAMAESIWDRVTRPTSIFVERHGVQHRLKEVLAALRADIRAAVASGEPWQAPFDDFRDSVWQVWPNLTLADKHRFMRHLRTWYDVHRFRLPPTVEAKLNSARDRGQLRYRAARIVTAEPAGNAIAVDLRDRQSGERRSETFDAVVNCTGPEPRPSRTDNPFMRALIERRLARDHPVGIGFDIDSSCAAIGADGTSDPNLRVFGPLTIGQFGDAQGTPFIVAHICRVMPEIADLLEAD